MNDLYVLEWSKRHNAFRVAKLELALSMNREAYTDNRAADYVPLYVGTKADVDGAAEAARPTLSARWMSA